MRYLFFDIECCDGRHICEFGYVICDGGFNILESDVITVNPERRFYLTGRKGSEDIVLFFDEETYFESPTFPFYYDKIKSLLEQENQIIIGHSIGNDAAFIRTACQRYNLDPINFKFADSQRMYSEYTNDKQQISLENAEIIFDLPKPNYLHKSDEDAILTMRLVQSICERLSASVSDVLLSFPSVCGKSENFEITYFGEELSDILKAIDKNPDLLSNSKKQKAIKQFYKNALPQGEIENSPFYKKAVCFPSEFEKNDPKSTIILIQMLINCGAKYVTKVSDVDFYVATDDELTSEDINPHSRYYSALCVKKSERNINIISFDELFAMLGITKSSLLEMPMPNAPEKVLSNAPPRYYSHADDAIGTIGENLKARGLDLSKLYS